MKRFLRRGGAAVALALVASTFAATTPAQAVDPSLPSLWRAYQDDFVFGTFGDWSSDQAKQHYRTSSPANALKLDSQIGNSNTANNSRTAYVARIAEIDASTTMTDADKAAARQLANENVVLAQTDGPGQSETILKAIQAYNAAQNLPADERKVVRAHVLAWHGGQQPNYFFADGFTYDAANPNWASPQTMLKRLDNYIRLMMAKYKPYRDIIYSWDVVNEAVDDYTGQIRNGQDPQVSQWGIVFRRPDLDRSPNRRLEAESAWVRQAFESARTWSEANDETWKLYYNDYQDSNKLYEPKLSQTIKMLRPIHAAGTIDGYGMQARLSYSYPSIEQLRAQVTAGLTVADEVSISESDIRSDFEPNPNYDPAQPTRPVTAADATDTRGQWPEFGSCNYANRMASNGNTFDTCNSPVRRIPAWGINNNVELADSPAIMAKQADYAADWMDVLLSFGDKIKAYQFDGLNDFPNTFNRNDGAQLWSGAADHHEKYSFFSVLGAPARKKLREAIAVNPGAAALYTPASYATYLSAKQAAQALVPVRIYDLAAVNAVKNATTALTSATAALTKAGPPPVVTGPPSSKPALKVKVRNLGSVHVGKPVKVVIKVADRSVGKAKVKYAGTKRFVKVRKGRAVITVRFPKVGSKRLVVKIDDAKVRRLVRVRP